MAITVLADVLALSEENYMTVFARSFFDEWFRITLVVHKTSLEMAHDDVIKWKHFPRYWPCVRGIITGEFLSQRPVTRSFDFSLIYAWINGWVDNREAGDLRCHHAHYDVIVIWREPALRVFLFHCINPTVNKILANLTSNTEKCRTALKAWNHNCKRKWFIAQLLIQSSIAMTFLDKLSKYLLYENCFIFIIDSNFIKKCFKSNRQ